MGYLTTLTIYNDECDQIKKNPEEFAEQVYEVCTNPSVNYRSNVFHGIVIPQKTRHADDKTVYVHAGNTVCEMNPYSNTTKEIMERSPEFFKEMLELMEHNVKELKKQFKESQSHDKTH